jgi:Stress responsive A/B Barrel Domain
MICHVVLIRLREGSSSEEGNRLCQCAREMLAPIPGVRNLRVGRGLGKKAEVSYPYALVMDFEDEEALEAYQIHEDHRRFVREVVDPIQDDKKVYDYQV